MIQVASHEGSKHLLQIREVAGPGNHKGFRTEYVGFTPGEPNRGQAWLLDSTPHRVLRAHYHETDQFQVIIDGDGMMGKHHLVPHLIHFSRAHTPYGPILWGEKGMGLLTIRPRKDTLGAPQFMPESREKMKQIPGRKPWQLSAMARYPATGTAIERMEEFRDERGLAVYAATVAPGASLVAPPPAHSDGQFILVMRGSMLYQGQAWPAFSVVYLTEEEQSFTMVAGPDGLNALVLNFPEGGSAAKDPVPAGGANKAYICEACAFVYDEAAGLPEQGIAPGTPWSQVPESWGCPDCSATKADFKPFE